MNLLTGPVFTLSDGETFRQASLEEILRGDHSGFRFSSGGTLQSLAQWWLACTLVGVLQNGEDLNPEEDEVLLDEVLDTLLARIVEDAPNYELLAPEGSPRFLQVEFTDPKKHSNFSGELTTRNFLVADQTSSPFSNKLILEEHSYCPACAAKDFFLFQKIVPGAGKGAGGPWGAGTLLFLDEGEDARSTILANTLVRPTLVRMDPMREALRKAGQSRVPSWVRPDLVEALRQGSVLSPDSPLLDLTVVDLWMTRQVWLSHRDLDKEAPCISCGSMSKVSVCGYKDGARKAGGAANAEETRDWGCMKLAGKVPSLYHPWRETEEKGEDGVLLKGVALRPLRGTRASDLLPAAVEFFDQGSSTRAAITYGDRMVKSGGRGRGSIQVFGLIAGDQAGTFGSAFSYNIPFQDSIFELGPKLQAMDTVTEKTRKRLWAATAGGLSKAYDLKGCKPFQQKGELQLKNAANTFPNFLAREVEDYEKMLQATARNAYQILVLDSPAIQTPDQREAAASSFPFYQTFAGASMSKTSFTEAFDNYRKKFQDNGLRADLRRIRVNLQGVEASSTPFSSGIFSYLGSKQEVMRDAQIVMIHLMAGGSPTNNSGLGHKEGVSFGQALRRACGGDEKAVARAALLADAAKSSPNKFFFEFAQFVGRQGGFSCDLDALYWDLYKILVDGDKSRATRWWVDLYRPIAAPVESAEAADSAA